MPSRVLEALPALALRPCYDIRKSWSENAERGPHLDGPLPNREWPSRAAWIDFLGLRVASPLGVPAGPLLNSKWISFAAQLGFDIVCYKTIRSYAQSSHPLPNIVFVKTEDGNAIQIPQPPHQYSDLGITNSFGNPSREPEFLQQDIQLARDCLRDGQLLIVSVFGTGNTLQELANDYARAAVLAKESGAHIIEANFSCPNLAGQGGSLYSDIQQATVIAQHIVHAIGATPLIIKMGRFNSYQDQRDVFVSLARIGVRAVCGINTIPMAITKADGSPALPGRLVGGVCGGPIRQEALAFVQQARYIIDREKLDLALLGCGGIMTAEHFNQFLDAGANSAMSATGMMWDPYIAMRWHHLQEENRG